MAFTDDFAIIGAAADNFDCDSLTGWTDSSPGANTLLLTLETDNIEGTNAIGMQCGQAATGVRSVYQDVSSGSRFKITDESLNFWFRYSKGKGDNYLTTAGSALIVRLYFGGTTDWADYQVTDNGDTDLKFGYQVLQCSGRNLNGGSTSGTWSNTASNWERDIHRVELRMDFANANDGGTTGDEDALLLMDCWFSGTKITVSEGTAGGTPTTLADLVSYQALGGSRTGFPLELIVSDGPLTVFRCGIDIGNGSNGANNEGYLQITEASILFDQWSAQVKQNITVKNFSQLDFGEGESVTGVEGTNTAAVRGCQIVLPLSVEDELSTSLPPGSDVSVENGGELNVYDSKFFQWRDIFLGAASDTGSTVELNSVRFDSCETIYFRPNTLNVTGIEIYNNAGNDRPQCAEAIATADISNSILLHDCIQGIHYRDSVTWKEYTSQDNDKSGNSNFDLGVLEGETINLVDSTFSVDKIRWLPV